MLSIAFSLMQSPARIRCLLFAFSVFVLAKSAMASPSRDRPRIVVSLPAIAMLVKELAPDAVVVETILAGGMDPHFFELRPSSLRKLSSADLILFVGGGTESWAKGIEQSVGARLVLLEGGASKAGGHVWLSPVRSIRLAESIGNSLCGVVPSECDAIRRRVEVFRREIEEWRQGVIGEAARWSRRAFVSAHPAWKLFAEDLSLEEAAVLKPSDSSTLSGVALASVLDRITRGDVGAVVLDPYTPRSSLAGFLEDAKLPVVVLDELGNSDESYLQFLRSNLSLLRGALR